MTIGRLAPDDRVGLLGPSLDAHTLGLGSAARLLSGAGVRVVEAGAPEREAASAPGIPANARTLASWVRSNRVSILGFSYRLDPGDGERLFSALVDALRGSGSLAPGYGPGGTEGGTVRALVFAGLPAACALVAERHPGIAACFSGEETPAETLAAFGVAASALGSSDSSPLAYDEARLRFGRSLVASGDYRLVKPVDRSGSLLFGRRGDSLAARVDYGRERGLPPLLRAHVGPYLPDRREAVSLFYDWARRLGKGGFLDVLSIGTSQLSQSAFGEDHDGLLDGGGVPLNSREEFAEAWRAARPMLVRTYAGTKDVPGLARMYEETLDMAWHALSVWWFCETDGRGPNGLLANIEEHLAAMRYIASTGKPVEPNVPHHFAFRGGDDLTYVVSGYLAARAAKLSGARQLVLQTMLNTPRSSWGAADLAKARALLGLVRGLEDGSFRVFLQPRGGLDYFSADEDKAKSQLAAVTALMDDIEPRVDSSPDIIHVVSHSEGRGLADPGVVEESARITLAALAGWRRERAAGRAPDLSPGLPENSDLDARTAALAADARVLIAAFESSVPDPYSARGLYEAMASGFLAAPWLSSCRDELAASAAWRTAIHDGGVVVVDEGGKSVPAAERAALCAETARSRLGGAGKGTRWNG